MMVRRTGQHLRTATERTAHVLRQAQQQLQQMRPLVQRVLAQTRARLFGGDTHVPDKVLSVFEPHTEAIRKGKIAKPTEFGKLVTIQEAEHQIVTAFEVHAERPADVTLWAPALDRHQRIFRRAPDLATGDKGLLVGRQRTRRPRTAACGAWCCPRAAGNRRPPRPRTTTLVSSRATMAHRLRRTDQCA